MGSMLRMPVRSIDGSAVADASCRPILSILLIHDLQDRHNVGHWMRTQREAIPNEGFGSLGQPVSATGSSCRPVAAFPFL
jgi:hypothetical protein